MHQPVKAGRSKMVHGSSHECIKLPCVSLKHRLRQPPEDEKGCHGEKKGAQEQEGALCLLWLLHLVGFGKAHNVTRSTSIGRPQLDSPRQRRYSEYGTLLKQAVGQLLGFLYSIYVLFTFPLEEYRAIDRSADPKGKLQLTVF
jgi:hypothetical protein